MAEDENLEPLEELNKDSLELGPNGNSLGRNQKIAVVFLSIFGIFIIVFWGIQLKNNISNPFDYENLITEEENDDSATCQGSQCAGEDAELRLKDTDNDGLSDWDELNIYKTSPYLEDSDSDGFNDKEELDNDKDPNCPVGQDCGEFNSEQINTSDTTDDILDEFNFNTSDFTVEPDQEEALQDALSGLGDANSLRQLLLDAGMDPEDLNQISDEDLMASYEEVLNQ